MADRAMGEYMSLATNDHKYVWAIVIDVVCYVKIILTNQKYALIVFSGQIIKLRGISTPKRVC